MTHVSVRLGFHRPRPVDTTRMEEQVLLGSDNEDKPDMFSDDSDLDALLDAQSSGDDEGDEHVQVGVERTIDDILNDFDEFGLDALDSTPSTPHRATESESLAGQENHEFEDTGAQAVGEEHSGEHTVEVEENELGNTVETIGDDLAVDANVQELASSEASLSYIAGGSGSTTLSSVDVAEPESENISVVTFSSSEENGVKDQGSTAGGVYETGDTGVGSHDRGELTVDEVESSERSDDEIEYTQQATWEADESDVAEDEATITSQPLSSEAAIRVKEDGTKEVGEGLLLDTDRREQCTALDKAEEFERRVASSGLHFEEGAAAQPMRLEGIQRGPPAIGILQLDSGGSLSHALGTPAMRRDHGYPQALAVHANFIAVGMSKGGVLVTSSKYAPTRSSDSAESKAFFLGGPDKSLSAVSAMCFNQQGDMLLVGYSNGSVILWDLTRAAVAKSIPSEHSAAIINAVFLWQDFQAARQMKAITGDCKGLVLLHTFTTVPLLRRVSLTTQCLLDGQRNGIALSVTPMLPDEDSQANGVSASAHTGLSANSLGLNTMMGGVAGVVGGVSDVGRKYLYDTPAVDEGGGLVVFVTQQTSLVVRLIPALEVCAKFPRPQTVSESAIPYTAWRRGKPSSSSSDQPIPAARGLANGTSTDSRSNTESLVSTAERPEGDKGSSAETGSAVSSKNIDVKMLPVLAMAWDKKVFVMQLLKSELKVTAEWDLDSTAAGVAWLDEQMLVILTLDNQLCLFTKDGFEVERASLGGDEAVTYLSHFVNQFGNPEKMYNSSLAVRGAALYLLGPSQLWRTCLLPWQDRIKALQDAGDWMGAFHIAMELYDGKARGVTGLPRGLEARRDVIMPTLLSLLSAYIDEAFAYLSLAYSSYSTPTKTQSASLNVSAESVATMNSLPAGSALEVKDQYARVGGVAIEFCVHIKKTDVLFESVFNKFERVGQRGIFLELLEPYILKDMLGALAPEVMQALVEHYSEKGWLQRVEQCILHMDIGSLDFNQVVRLCRENGLYSALIYLFNKGLDDFKSPLEELLAVAQDPQNPQCESFGYKLLVYLKYSFLGLSFPPGHGVLSPTRLPSLRVELLQFLLDPVGNEGDQAVRKSKIGQGKTFPRLCYLLELDTKAALQIFSLAFPEDGPLGVGKLGHAYSRLQDSGTPELEVDQNVAEATPYMQAVVNALVHVLEAAQYGISKTSEDSNMDAKGYESWPTEEDAGYILRFVARYVASRHAIVASNTLSAILENLTTMTESTRLDEQARFEKESVMLELLQGLPEEEWNATLTLQRAQQAQFWQVTALIHTKNGDITSALDSYLLDTRQPQHAFVFIMAMLHPENRLKHVQLLNFRETVINRIPKLLTLSRQRTLAVVLEHFSKENDIILTRLAQEPYLLFSYLKALMDVRTYGLCHPLPDFREQCLDMAQDRTLVPNKEVNLSDLLQQSGLQFTDEMAEMYVELLCQFDPKSVLRFLESYENYRLEHCLKLCQEYEVKDAAVFILERVGDVASALSLVLADVEPRLHDLEKGVVQVFPSRLASGYHNVVLDDNVPEVQAVNSVMRDAVSLCQRNTLRLDPRESELLWFRLLDRFVDPLCDLNLSNDILPTKRAEVKTLHRHGKGTFQWNRSLSKLARESIRRTLIQLMGEIVDGMMGFVPLQDIMEKILTDHGGHEFGDFRGTILEMLSTYGFECALLGTAKQLIEDDIYSNISTLKKFLAQAHAPCGCTCCICDLNLMEPHMVAQGRTSKVTGTTESSGSNEKLQGKMAEEEAADSQTASESSGVYIFACGHSAHSTCLESSPQWDSAFAGCPVCSLQKPTKESPSTTHVSAMQKQTVQPKLAGGLKTPRITENGRSNSAERQQPGRSRWELLNSLHRGKGTLEFGPSLQLSLSPPKVSRKKHVSTPQRSRSSAQTSSSQGPISGRRPVSGALSRDLIKSFAARPTQQGIRERLEDTFTSMASGKRRSS